MRIADRECEIFLAPIAGYTDAGFRYLCKKYGADLTYTEMVSAKGLCFGGEKTAALLQYVEEERPAAQIFSGEEEYIMKAMQHPALSTFSIIDINMGCPVPKIVKNGEGSALMKDADKAKRIAESAVKYANGRAVTAKIRAGFYENERTAPILAKALQEAGVAAVTVHGRTRHQYYSGNSDESIIEETAHAVSIPVIANGDIKTAQDVARLLKKGASGVMIARAALGNPYLFSQLKGKTVDIASLIKNDILLHLEIILKFHNEKYCANTMKKHLVRYSMHTPHAKAIKMEVSKETDLKDIYRIIETYF